MTETTERVMVDIETLGLEPGSVILSIGAVTFDVDGIHDNWYLSVDLESCQDHGLEIDASTLDWWLSQDDSVQTVLTGGEDLPEALEQLSRFYGTAQEVWAFSPSFDVAHLDHAYDAVGIVPPWSYKETRDCRTLASLPQWPDLEQEGMEHNALHDARYQATCTIECLNRIHGENA